MFSTKPSLQCPPHSAMTSQQECALVGGAKAPQEMLQMIPDNQEGLQDTLAATQIERVDGGASAVLIQVCSMCKGPVGERPVKIFDRASDDGQECVRCRGCHNMRSRLGSLLRKHASLKESWTEAPAAAKQKFFAKAKELYGDALKICVEETIEEVNSSSSKVGFKGKASWMTDEQMTDHFIRKPWLKDKVKKMDSTRTMVHHQTEEMMWEVYHSFESYHGMEDECREERRRKASTEETAKAKARPKKKAKKGEGKGNPPAEGENGAAAEGEVGDAALNADLENKNKKVLTAKQKEGLAKMAQKLQEANLKLVGVKVTASAPEMADFVPARAMTNSDEISRRISRATDDFKEKIGLEKVPKEFYKEATAATKEIVEEAKHLTSRIQSYIDDANMELDEGAGADGEDGQE